MKENKKLNSFIVIITLLLFICFVSLILHDNSSSKTANIYLDNVLIRSVVLSDMDADSEFTIESEYGYNKINVKNGKICISEADCPDKTCVKTGWTDSAINPIICIPHRLEIVINKTDENNITDGVAG